MAVVLLLAFCFVASFHQGANGLPLKHREERLFLDPHVFLTLNAIAQVEHEQLLNRLIEVNWYNVEVGGTNWIGLFKHDPSGDQGASPIVRIRPTTTEGQVTTRTRFDVIDYHTAHIPEDHCMGYWVAYFVGTTMITSNCIRIYPNWMREMREVIGDKKLTDLMIPGTHNSGSWSIYRGAEDDRNVVLNFAPNHEDDIYTQLVHGIRYLDLRIGSYPDTDERFWINHGDFRMHPLQTVIDDIRSFLETNNEIVIMDIHQLPVGFSGPNDPEHGLLLAQLEAGLRDLLYLKSRGRDPTLNEIWRTRKNVILTYPVQNSTFPESIDFIVWPSLYHDWANVNDIKEMEEHFEGTLPTLGCNGTFVVSMAELTATVADIAFKFNVGLRGYAQVVNGPLTTWWQREDWYSKTNIVATDYYLGNNIIEMAMEVNLNNATCPI